MDDSQDGMKTFDWYGARDANGRPCLVLFSDEDLVAHPELATDPVARASFLARDGFVLHEPEAKSRPT